MKEVRFRIFIIALIVLGGLWALYPTYQDYQNTKELKKIVAVAEDSIKKANPEINERELQDNINRIEDNFLVGNESVREARDKRIKLGLDLQGGMYLVLEVNTTKLLEKLAKQPDEVYNKLLDEADAEARQGTENVFSILARKLQENNIRLSRYFGNITQEDSEIISEIEEQESDAVSRAMEIIRNRVDQYGVSEPIIQKQGSRRVVVQLPGVSKEEEAKRLLQGRALLEFKLVKDPEFTFPVVDMINQALLSKDSTKQIADSLLANLPEDQRIKAIQEKYPFFFYTGIDRRNGIADGFVLERNKEIVENLLKKTEVQKVIPENVEFVFSAKADRKGAEGQSAYTLYLVNKVPELTGGVVVDAQATRDPGTGEPVVSMQMNSEGALEWARITGANVQKRCAVILDGKVYTAPVINEKIPSGSSQISGSDSFEEAKLLQIVLKAGALPAPVDIVEERTVGPSLGEDSIRSGLNASWIGFLLIAIFMILYYKMSGAVADMSLIFNVIFMMAILSLFNATLTLPGIAGIILSIGMAVDANVLIYERIYEEYSTGKTLKAAVDSGFKNSYSAILDSQLTTLVMGIILYNFGSGPIQGFALTLIIGIVTSLFGAFLFTKVLFEIIVAKGWNISIGNRKGWLDSINFDWIANRKYFYIVSGCLVLISIISFTVRGLELGVDFLGGSEIGIKFNKPVDISNIRTHIEEFGLKNVEVKSFGGDDGVLIKTELQEIPKDIFPKVLLSIKDAIRKADPQINPEIVDSTKNSVTFEFASFDEAQNIANKLFQDGFQSALVSMENDNKLVQIRVGIADWIKENLRNIYKDNKFKIIKEEKVGAQIGSELKQDALLAIVFGLIAIMLYMGFRFKFVFGFGAIASLFHDVIVTLGVFSLFYGVFPALNLEISITVIAALLTLIGYSVNDSVVIFDRIRENFTIHKTASLEENINKANNRTIRRTLVTGIGTILAIVALLVGGGDVLRGFSFTLLLGIVIGTYSSFLSSQIVYDYTVKMKKKMDF